MIVLKSISLELVMNSAIAAIRRFPLVVLCGIIASAAAILALDVQTDAGWLWHIINCALLGLPLYLAIDLAIERYEAGNIARLSAYLGALGVLAVYFFSLPSPGESWPYTLVLKFSVLSLVFHLMVAFSPFLKKDDSLNGFWQYNKTLFLRFVTGILFTMVLYSGLSIALVAIQTLFGIAISSENYGRLYILLIGIFNTLFFLSGIPKSFDELADDKEHPRGLRIFGQFILLPLSTVYLGILYVYGLQIITNMELPKGWVGYLIIAFSVVAALTWLFLYPYSRKEEFSWMPKVWRGFNLSMIPLVVLLFIALNRRISDYGLTEMRYFGVLVGACIAVFTVYFLFSQRKDIRIIPVLLCAAGLLSSFGPLGSSSMSKNNQFTRLTANLNTAGILQEGKVSAVSTETDFAIRKEISSQVEYLVSQHGYEVFQPLYAIDLDSLLSDKQTRYSETQYLVKEMGFDYVGRWMTEENNYSYYYASSVKINRISGYDYWIPHNYHVSSNDTLGRNLTVGGVNMLREFEGDKPTLTFSWDRYPNDPITMDLKPVIAQAKSLMRLSQTDKINARALGQSWGVQLNITSLRIQKADSLSGLGEMRYELLIDEGNDAEEAE